MPNIPEIEKAERRLKVRQLLLKQPSSYRNISKIAQELNIDPGTVLRDIACLRREARRRQKHEKLDMKMIEIYERYLYELEEIESDIEAAQTADDSEHNTWFAVAALRKTKVEVIEKIAELWGLINSKGVGVYIGENAGGTKISTPHAVIFSAIREECENNKINS